MYFHVHLVLYADSPEWEIRAKARLIMTLNDHYFSRSASSLFSVGGCCNFHPSANFSRSEDVLWTNLNQVQVISVGHQPKNKNVPATSTQKLKYSGFRGTPQPCSGNYCRSWQRSAVNHDFSSCFFSVFGESQKDWSPNSEYKQDNAMFDTENTLDLFSLLNDLLFPCMKSLKVRSCTSTALYTFFWKFFFLSSMS